MTINRTTLLDLPLPVTGTESGTWGDIVNNGLSEYIDISVAGSLSLSADSDTNLSSTEGNAAGTNIGSTTAQYAILRCTGARTATRNINAPAWAISGGTLTNYSKIYIVVNETTGSQNIVLRATNSATPTYTTGVTIVPGERAVCAWNGSDFVKVGGAAGGSTTQIQFNNAGVFGGSANLTWDGTNVQIGATGALRLADTDSSNYVAFKSPGTVASNVTWTLPSADGTNGQALTTNGSGTLAFSSVTTSPGGSTTQVQYNNAGAFGGSANFVFDGTNVGIGTSSPSSFYSGARKLVVGGASGEQGLTIYSGDNFGYLMFATGTSGTNPYSGQVRYDQPTLSMQVVNFQNGPLQFLTNNTERMRITSGGNLLVGTTAAIGAADRLSVSGGNLTVQRTTIQTTLGDNGTSVGYVGTISNNDFMFLTNSTERMRITNTGNVGIGVTPSAWSSYTVLQIKTAALWSGNSQNSLASLTANTYYDGTNYRYIASDYATEYYEYQGAHVWRTAPSGTAGNAITFTQVLAVEKDKSLALQGATSQSGTGITFPATQSASTDANTLDDYEEGDWTPSIGGNATYGGDTDGRYVKVGKVVTVWGKIQITTKGTGSATTISGLPFTSANLGLESSGSTTYYNSLAVNVITPQAYVATNSTSVQFYSATSAGTTIGSTSSIFGDGSRIYFTVTYETST